MTRTWKLFSYCTSAVKDKFNLGSRKQNDANVDPHDFQKLGAGSDGWTNFTENPGVELGRPECSSHDFGPAGGSDVEKNVELASDESPASMCSLEMSKPGCENNHIHNKPLQTDSSTGIGSWESADSKERTPLGQLDVAKANELDDAQQTQQIISCEKLGAHDTLLNADLIEAFDESQVDPNMKDVDAMEEDSLPKVDPSGDVGSDLYKGESDTDGTHPCSNILESERIDQIDESNVVSLQNPSISDHKLENREDMSRLRHTGVIEKFSENDNDDNGVIGNYFVHDFDFSGSAFCNKEPDNIDKRPDIDLAYGTFDSLEVARQVAIEVEREVDCREPSCSCSERISVVGGIRLTKNPDAVLTNADNLVSEQDNHDMDLSQGSVATREKHRGIGFDLNEEILTDDMDTHTNSIGAPISCVSVSRAATNTELPGVTLQFEGILGRNRSAETNAFRPAPPHLINEGETLSLALGSYNSRQRQYNLNFDLNVVESQDDKVANLTLAEGIPKPYDHHTHSVGSRKTSDGFQLDLSLVSDGGVASSYNTTGDWLLQQQNGHHTPSPSLSSSSVQPSFRNVDLNDQPSLSNYVSGLPLSSPTYGHAGHIFNVNSGSLKQFLNSGQGSTSIDDENSRANTPPTSTVGVRRKREDSDLQPYSFNYKRQQPPWK